MTSFQRTACALLLLGGTSLFAQTDAKGLYLSKCAVCHGPDGAGQTAKGKKLKMKGVAETSKKMSDGDMVKIVDGGKGPDMDAFGKTLSKEQIKSLVDYYRGLAK